MLVQRLTSFDEMIACRDRWNELAEGIPFRRWEWLATWWKHFQDRGKLYLLRVTSDDGRLVGIAPWLIEQNTLSGRVVQPLGSGITCSDYLGVLVDPMCRPQVLDALVAWLIEANGPGSADGWDILQFDGIDSEDAVFQELLAKLERRDCTVHCQPGLNCWRIPLPSTWEEYLQQRPKPQRKRMRQAREMLESGTYRVTYATDASSLEYVWQKFVDLHQRRRLSLGQPGCFADEAFGAFLQETTEEFLRQRAARLVLLERDDQAVVTLLTFTGSNASYGYQMGTNPDFLADSPGWLVICAALLAGIENRESALDLLRGDESYKGRMGGVPHEMLQVRVVPAQLGARLRHTAWLTGAALKTWIKTGMHVAGITPAGPESASS